MEEAKKTGAMALFGEKYGEKVRVVSMGDFSSGAVRWYPCSQYQRDHCISRLYLKSGIAAGVRRIEALTGDGVLAYYKEHGSRSLHEAAKAAERQHRQSCLEKIEHLYGRDQSTSE